MMLFSCHMTTFYIRMVEINRSKMGNVMNFSASFSQTISSILHGISFSQIVIHSLNDITQFGYNY